MVALRLPRAPFRHAIYSHGVYLVPRRDGRVLAGSTYEQVGYDKRVTGDGLQGILERTFRVAPRLADATFVEAWAGLRPGTPDNLPILGADASYAGLYHATGHYRSGILLAPVTARLMRELIVDGAASVDLAPFAPARFARRTAPPARTARRRAD
jgi:glycine oxidase